MTETTGIQYMERDGIHYPILEEEMKETEVPGKAEPFRQDGSREPTGQ